MKKKSLTLHRETVRNLISAESLELEKVAGGDVSSDNMQCMRAQKTLY